MAFKNREDYRQNLETQLYEIQHGNLDETIDGLKQIYLDYIEKYSHYISSFIFYYKCYIC